MRRRLLVAVLATGLVVSGAVPLLADASAPGGSFRDDDGNIHEGFIEAIAAAGITLGCNPPMNDRFCPDGSVTRGQMAAFLVRALELPVAKGDYFSDDGGSVFEADINRLAASGITRGCNPPGNDPSLAVRWPRSWSVATATPTAVAVIVSPMTTAHSSNPTSKHWQAQGSRLGVTHPTTPDTVQPIGCDATRWPVSWPELKG